MREVVSFEVRLIERSGWLDKETPRDALTVLIIEQDSRLVLLGTFEKGKLEPFRFVEDARPMLDVLAIGEDDWVVMRDTEELVAREPSCGVLYDAG